MTERTVLNFHKEIYWLDSIANHTAEHTNFTISFTQQRYFLNQGPCVTFYLIK